MASDRRPRAERPRTAATEGPAVPRIAIRMARKDAPRIARQAVKATPGTPASAPKRASGPSIPNSPAATTAATSRARAPGSAADCAIGRRCSAAPMADRAAPVGAAPIRRGEHPAARGAVRVGHGARTRCDSPRAAAQRGRIVPSPRDTASARIAEPNTTSASPVPEVGRHDPARRPRPSRQHLADHRRRVRVAVEVAGIPVGQELRACDPRRTARRPGPPRPRSTWRSPRAPPAHRAPASRWS